jgi:hypothetical protein
VFNFSIAARGVWQKNRLGRREAETFTIRAAVALSGLPLGVVASGSYAVAQMPQGCQKEVSAQIQKGQSFMALSATNQAANARAFSARTVFASG